MHFPTAAYPPAPLGRHWPIAPNTAGPKLMRHHHIGIPFDHGHDSALNDLLPGHIQSKNRPALIEEDRLRAIEILGRVGRSGYDAPAKGDDLPRLIFDRKHDPIAENIVVAVAVFSRLDQSRLHQSSDGKLFPHWPLHQRIPGIEGQSELKLL